MEMNLEMAPRCRCLGALDGAFEDDARMQSEVHLVIMPGSWLQTVNLGWPEAGRKLAGGGRSRLSGIMHMWAGNGILE